MRGALGFTHERRGLLGAIKGRRRPIAFVEDCGVPPENLSGFLREFIALLHKTGVHYGIFGHVDAGVCIRPAIDSSEHGVRDMLRDISDQVDAMVRRHGGVIWAEHGKGFRGEYATRVFGDELFQVMKAIKTVCDPHDVCNRGKISTSLSGERTLIPLDRVPLRGDMDQQIPARSKVTWASAMECNGNGACHDWDPDHVMCPSTKVRDDRLHSPKGRAGMLREWLRRGAAGVDLAANPVADATRKLLCAVIYSGSQRCLDGCLSCKACTGSCPPKSIFPL